MKKVRLLLATLLLVFPLMMQAGDFTVGRNTFLLNGEPFVVKAAEVHYPRIPRPYWEHRIQMCKSLGMNTLCIYVFWNLHEPREGQFDFTGNSDVAEFCRLAQKNGMYVIVRPGPYVCAEWEMGGLPWWLLKKKDIRLREQDPYFMERVRIFEEKVAEQLAPLTIQNGGPIIMVQVENEYGSYGEDKAYISAIRDTLRKLWSQSNNSQFSIVNSQLEKNHPILFQCDWSSNFELNGLDDLVWTMNFGTGANIDEQFKRLKQLRPDAPLMCSEFWSGWFDKWGANHETRPAKDMVDGIDEMLSKNISFSLYMTHGGTSFGHWAGANSPGFAPDVTSYDYDAPINEYGGTTEKFFKLRKMMQKYSKEPLPAIPAPPAMMISIPPFELTERADIILGADSLVMNSPLLTMEDMDQGWGSMLYIATLPTTRDYLEGSYMDYTGLVVMAMYQDGTTEDITGLVTLAPENGAKLETVGEVPCVVTYTDEDGNAYRDGFSVTVTPKVLESIVITSLPTKLEYVLGQPYDYSGLEVTAFYNNNTSEVVTDRCTITPAEGSDTDTAGEIPVLVSFTKDDVTQTADFNVNVLVLDHIEVTTPPDVTEFTEDDPYDYTGVEITAYFDDGTTWDVTEDCTFSPAPGSTATMGTDTVTVTYAPSAVSQATATFPITVKEKPKKKVRAIQLLATTYEDSLARIRSVLNIPNKMLQRIEAKRQSVFGGASLNIVLAAGYCNYKGSGSTRYVLMDITPWVGTDKYLYEFIDPAYGISQGVQIPSDYPSYREFYPHQYMWENCTGNNMFFIVGSEGELQQDEGWTTPFLSDLILGFGSDVYNYNPFSQSGKQSYQALAANYLIVEVDDPNT